MSYMVETTTQKSTSFLAQVKGPKFQVVVPKHVREYLDIEDQDFIEFEVTKKEDED